MSFEPYQDIETWDRDRLDTEIEALYIDMKSGIMTRDMYRECYDIVLGEIIRREDEDDTEAAYNRAMKGI